MSEDEHPHSSGSETESEDDSVFNWRMKINRTNGLIQGCDDMSALESCLHAIANGILTVCSVSIRATHAKIQEGELSQLLSAMSRYRPSRYMSASANVCRLAYTDMPASDEDTCGWQHLRVSQFTADDDDMAALKRLNPVNLRIEELCYHLDGGDRVFFGMRALALQTLRVDGMDTDESLSDLLSNLPRSLRQLSIFGEVSTPAFVFGWQNQRHLKDAADRCREVHGVGFEIDFSRLYSRHLGSSYWHDHVQYAAGLLWTGAATIRMATLLTDMRSDLRWQMFPRITTLCLNHDSKWVDEVTLMYHFPDLLSMRSGVKTETLDYVLERRRMRLCYLMIRCVVARFVVANGDSVYRDSITQLMFYKGGIFDYFGVSGFISDGVVPTVPRLKAEATRMISHWVRWATTSKAAAAMMTKPPPSGGSLLDSLLLSRKRLRSE